MLMDHEEADRLYAESLEGAGLITNDPEAPNPSQAVIDAIDALLARWPRAEFGPGHIVLSDYNIEDHWIDACLASLDETPEQWMAQRLEEWLGHSPDEHDAVRAFLYWLRAIPEEDRYAEE